MRGNRRAANLSERPYCSWSGMSLGAIEAASPSIPADANAKTTAKTMNGKATAWRATRTEAVIKTPPTLRRNSTLAERKKQMPTLEVPPGGFLVGSNTHETNDDITRKHGFAKLLILRPPAVLRTRLPPDPGPTHKTRIVPRRSGFSLLCCGEMKVGPAKRNQSASPFSPTGNSMQLSQGPAVISFPEYGRFELRIGRVSGSSATVRAR